MSKKQKGRKHRTVNRTPRPVRSTAPPAPVAVPAQGSASEKQARQKPLGHHASRTYVQLAEHGPHSVQELCETVGYTKRTIDRHLEGLAQQGLALRSADGRWTATDRKPEEAAVG